jgi:stage II sporulation protein D
MSRHFLKFVLAKLAASTSHKRPKWWLSALLWVVMIAPAQAALELRVAIEDGVKQVTVGSQTKAVVKDESGNVLGEVAAMDGFAAEARAGRVALDRWQAGLLSIEPTEGGLVYIGDRWYRGKVVVVPTAKGLTAVNYVDLEQYLYSVLGSEMSCNWPTEALKAQAVAARSYALFQRQKSANDVFDVGDTAGWQVYEGIAKECNTTQAAVNSTAGQVLTHNGKIIEAVFHSSSGGHTENCEDVWVQALPYLRAVPDFDLHDRNPNAKWTASFSRSTLSSRISGVGNVISLQPELTPNGRVRRMKVVGDQGSRTLTGEAFRSALGLKSTLFQVTSGSDRTSGVKSNTAPDSFIINGRGWGHGLGLSQWGAFNLALQGRNYQQIVLHYYKGTALAKIQVQ